MKNKTKIRIFIFTISLSAILNFIWPIDGLRWAYWVSRFLLAGIFLCVGLVFMFSPKISMQILIEDKQDYEEVASWRLIASGLLIGIPALTFAIWYFVFIGNKWIEKCIDIIFC